MKFDKSKLRSQLQLYAITDRSWLGEQTLSEQVEQALIGGATIIQYREKSLSSDEIKKEALQIKDVCQKYQIPFIVNDNVKLAIEIDADGVHVGQKDMNSGRVRKMIGQDKILGVTAKTIKDAVIAESEGADYLGVGAVFPTSTKSDAKPITFEQFLAISQAVKIPIVAIGGITKDNLADLSGLGIAGIAVVNAIFAQSNIKQSTMDLREKIKEIL